MRALLTLVAVAAALVLAGSGAGATTVTVTISKTGYAPKTTTVAAGDTIRFTNTDTVAHQVVFKQTKGVTCTANPVVVQPSQTASCTFGAAGKYTYADATVKGGAFQGTVTVKAGAAAAVTVRSAPQIVVFGGRATVSGTLSTGQAGENVQILAQQCGAGAAKAVGAATTTAGGAFTVSVVPAANTVYSVKLKGATSNTTTVQVRPRLGLAKLGAHRYRVRVFAGTQLTGKYVSFQRFRGAHAHPRWTRVRAVTLTTKAPAAAGTTVSGATFRSSIRAGVKVRAAMPQAQAAACYLGGASNTIRS